MSAGPAAPCALGHVRARRVGVRAPAAGLPGPLLRYGKLPRRGCGGRERDGTTTHRTGSADPTPAPPLPNGAGVPQGARPGGRARSLPGGGEAERSCARSYGNQRCALGFETAAVTPHSVSWGGWAKEKKLRQPRCVLRSCDSCGAAAAPGAVTKPPAVPPRLPCAGRAARLPSLLLSGRGEKRFPPVSLPYSALLPPVCLKQLLSALLRSRC